MASLTGCVGAVTIPATEGPAINVFEWTGDLRRDIFDDSDFNSASNARSKMGGMADMVGTVRGRCQTGVLPTLGDMNVEHDVGAAGFQLESDAANSKNYSFTGILSQVRVTTPKTGQIEVTATFESSGTVAVNAT
jgi:hypothetical protein